MKKRFMLGLIMLVPLCLLAGLYELLPNHQSWVVFGAMIGLAMSLGAREEPEEGGVKE